MSASRHRRGIRRRGFTIVEVIVAISVVVILLAIALPALRGARTSAIETAVLAHQRNSGSVLRAYMTEHNEVFPNFGVPGTNSAPLNDEQGEHFIDWWWAQPYCWGLFLQQQGYDAGVSQTGPERGYDPGVSSLDVLTYVAFAEPRFWRRGAPQNIADHRAQRWHTIAHPSLKVILRRYGVSQGDESPEDRARFMLWFADGHSAVRRGGDLRRPVHLRPWGPGGWPGLTTEDGLLGRDL